MSGMGRIVDTRKKAADFVGIEQQTLVYGLTPTFAGRLRA
jgi:hypothetical protein